MPESLASQLLLSRVPGHGTQTATEELLQFFYRGENEMQKG